MTLSGPEQSSAGRQVVHEVRTPRKRLALLAVVSIGCVVHFWLTLLLPDGPITLRAIVVNSVFFAAVVVALATLVAIWSVRGAVVFAAVFVGWIAGATAFVAHIMRSTR